MRKMLVVVLALALAAPLFAGKKGKLKIKEKRFDPVEVAGLAAAEGRYVGPDASYAIVLGGGGSTFVENGRQARLERIVVDGSRLAATAVFADGTSHHLRGTFVDRVLNGSHAFGILLEAPPFDLGDGVVTQAFYRRE